MGEGWEGVMTSAASQSRNEEKHPIDGAHGRARASRREVTEAERQIWQILRLRRMKGCKFRHQVPIGRYIVDFVCHDARLIVEVDGGQHDHLSQREAERSRFLQNQGYRILRLWNNEILENLDGVHATIADALSCVTPTQPSPIKGDGGL
jgi:very-short-patch-repair endonuclease